MRAGAVQRNENGRAGQRDHSRQSSAFTPNGRTEDDSGLAIGIRELFRRRGGDSSHRQSGDWIVDHPADSSILRPAPGLLGTTEPEEPVQPAALMLLVDAAHSAGEVLRRVIVRIEVIKGVALQSAE